MEFECKLAHSDERRRLSNFKSIKELYEQVSKSFAVPVEEILYCTLNTHNFRNMDAILGNYLSHGDNIIVHLCGESKDLQLVKTQEYLGLTITDNGQGRAFVKKVKSDQRIVEDNIKPGDHIAAINSELTIGMRHYEVAKAIRDVPQGTNFSIRLIVPRYSEIYLKQERFVEGDNDSVRLHSRGSRLTPVPPLDVANNFDDNFPDDNWITNYNNNDRFCDDLIHSSLPIERLLSKRALNVNDNQLSPYCTDAKLESKDQPTGCDDTYKVTIDEINSLLESFLGINDNLLAIQIYRLARENKDSYDNFLNAIQTSLLSAFNFDDELKNRLWKSAMKTSIIHQ